MDGWFEMGDKPVIEVRHDPFNLPAKRWMWSSCPKAAYKRLQDFVASKRSRGYKLRYNYDHNGLILLESRSSYGIEMAVRELKNSGLAKVTSPSRHPMQEIERVVYSVRGD